MSWVEKVEHVIADEYVVLAQCFPASDRGLDRYRALWLESVARELAPVLDDPTGTVPLPAPFDRLIDAFVAEEGCPRRAHEHPGLHSTGRRGAVAAFIAKVGVL